MMSGATGGVTLVDDVFSSYYYEGSSSTQTTTNGVDLAGAGGMVWIKNRQFNRRHCLHDTERGGSKQISSDLADAERTLGATGTITFNSDGWSVPSGDGDLNGNGFGNYGSWTFRKAPKFFDVVTYTGNGTAGRTVSHNLGSVPGCIFVKALSSGQSWAVYHRGVASDPETDYLVLNDTNAAVDNALYWNDTAPTATNFTVGTRNNVNGNGITYVAYLFAHNNGDGEFGPDGDQDIIKCGSYTGNLSSNGPTISLGFKPQWLLLKTAARSEPWLFFDGKFVTGVDGYDRFQYVTYNTSESTQGGTPTITFLPDGFKINNSNNLFNDTGGMVYIAIREGGDREITDASDVFYVEEGSISAGTKFNTGFFPWMILSHYSGNDSNNSMVQSGVIGYEPHSQTTNWMPYLATSTNANVQYTPTHYNPNSSGWTQGNYYGGALSVFSAFRKYRGFFDTTSWAGNGTYPHNVPHNLGVVPEMMWVKCTTNSSTNWVCYHKDQDSTAPQDYAMFLNLDNNISNQTGYWNDTAPTATQITLGNSTWVNDTSHNFIAMLFASIDGISKAGTYTGTGSSINIDCGFSSGASAVIIKAASTDGDWHYFDSSRGIIAGSEKAAKLNLSNGYFTTGNVADYIDPYNAGFTVNNVGNLSTSGVRYIYYAIAAI